MKGKKKALDPGFAPDGMEAVDVKTAACSGCHYEGSGRCGSDMKCAPFERPDGKRVIFKQKGG